MWQASSYRGRLTHCIGTNWTLSANIGGHQMQIDRTAGCVRKRSTLTSPLMHVPPRREQASRYQCGLLPDVPPGLTLPPVTRMFLQGHDRGEGCQPNPSPRAAGSGQCRSAHSKKSASSSVTLRTSGRVSDQKRQGRGPVRASPRWGSGSIREKIYGSVSHAMSSPRIRTGNW